MTDNNTYVEPPPEHHGSHLNILVLGLFVLSTCFIGTVCYSQQQTINGLRQMVTEQTTEIEVQEKVLSAWKKSCKKIP